MRTNPAHPVLYLYRDDLQIPEISKKYALKHI